MAVQEADKVKRPITVNMAPVQLDIAATDIQPEAVMIGKIKALVFEGILVGSDIPRSKVILF